MKNLLSAIQWMAFMMASSIVAPIAIAGIFHLNATDTADFVQRTIFILGLSGILQGIIGHRLPVSEGPAGLWWGVFAIYAGFVGTIYTSETESLQALQGGLLMSGVIFILLAAFGVIEKLSKLFTPTITFIYLMLLILQLSGSFMKGMMGLPNEGGMIQLPVMISSMITLIVAFYFGSHKIAFVRQYSVIISITVGWGLFALLGLAPHIPDTNGKWIHLPQLFVFGAPIFDSGTMVTAAFTTLLLIANMIASIRVMEETLAKWVKVEPKRRYRASGLTAGINQMLAGAFSAVGSVPISGSAGFVMQTKVFSVRPFLVGSGFVVIVSLIPPVMNTLSAIPAPVGYAVTFVIFSKMVGLAFSELDKEEDIKRSRTVAGVAFLSGVGAMFLPSSAFQDLPVIVTSVLNNGLIFGTIVAIIVEQWLIYFYNPKKDGMNRAKERKEA
ncbi:xanthine/uracil permease [Oikeobacillus pervagus]|uniref:Xanthine/uracil permease n=1 Tax=Oikeobacillus pervagus TaxID=1325931 RepID=A0AAJ1SZG5_9BACI|nr:purine/pyrimidine permease [Oikeobacillus pervagus]MDQ0214042.1 xanthine/uracil permease [Oikeobacillus pervagus]